MRLYVFPLVFYIFLAGLVAYILVLAIFLKKISKAKKALRNEGKEIPKATSSYRTIFPASIVLMILPLLIPLGNLITGTVVACAVLGLYISLRDRLSKLSEETKQKTSEKELMQAYMPEKNESENTPTQAAEKVKNRKKSRFFIILLCLILIICTGLFAYKKIMLDYDGTYATDRLTYTNEYGFCMLITYYPSYQKGNAKGFAVTKIPFGSLFTEKVQADKSGNDTADSKEMLDYFQLLASYGDNDLVDLLVKSLSDSEIRTKSLDIGNHGKYFILNAKDLGYETP